MNRAVLSALVGAILVVASQPSQSAPAAETGDLANACVQGSVQARIDACTKIIAMQNPPIWLGRALFARGGAWETRGDEDINAGNYDAAFDDLDRALADLEAVANISIGDHIDNMVTKMSAPVEADGIRAKYCKGTALLNMRLTAGLKNCNAVLALDPASASALYARGMIKLHSGDVPGGNADLTSAKAIDPKIADSFPSRDAKP